MYYPPSQKLGTDTWSRQPHLQVISPGSQQQVGPPPTSPGYGLYAQPPHHPHLGQLSQHHHISGQTNAQNSLNNHGHNPHYPSPPIQHVMAQGSPASVPLAQHWQQQLLKCEISRSSRSPHHRARASAMASRTVAKSAIPITNPNPKPPPEEATDSSLSGHPSSTSVPIAEPPRPAADRRFESNWTALDMGGVNIKNLPSNSGLFSFTFLVNLYLNHNALSSVPPEISQLRRLELLDLSGNSLTTLPPELGMLVSLKEFFIFDNQIMTLPPEFGTLHQLQTFGIEGNPLDTNLKNIVTKDGTSALISFLRDSCPVPTPPQDRAWVSFISPAEQEALPPSTETISVVCYNILCQKAATVRLYGYTPSWALAWEYRRNLILKELMIHGADFICLQEIDVASYEDYFVKHLGEAGYESVFWPKGRAKTMSNEAERRFVDGLATFYRADKYQLIEKHLIEFSTLAMQREDFKKTEDMFNRVLGKDHIATACAFETRDTGSRVLVANVHILWNPEFADVKLVQVALMAEEVEKIAEGFAKLPPRLVVEPEVNGTNGNYSEYDGVDGSSSSPPSPHPSSSPFSPERSRSQPRPKAPTYTSASQIPLIFCGDFNSIPESGVYEFLSTGSLSKDHPEFMNHIYGKYTGGGGEKGTGLKTWLGLRSAYNVTPGMTAGSAPSIPTASTPAPGGLRQPGSSSLRKSSSSHPSPELLPTTNYVSHFSGVLDYVWYGTANLAVNAVLGEVDPVYMSKVVGFPNAHFPSDHICIMAEFRVKPPRDPTENPPRPPPPVFS